MAILEHIDFTQYTNVAEVVAAHPTLTTLGTGHIFDPVKGFSGQSAGSFYFNNYDVTPLVNSGTITIEFEREAMAMDESENAVWMQTIGDVGLTRFLLHAYKIGDYAQEFRLYHQTNGLFAFLLDRADARGLGMTLNSQTPPDTDNFITLKLTWDAGTVSIFLDGVLVERYTFAQTTMDNSALWRFIIGANEYTGSNPLGNYFIRSFMIEDTASSVEYLNTKISVFGDSFMQSAVDDRDYSEAVLITRADSHGYVSAFDSIFRQMSGANRFYLNVNGNASTEQGHGWASDVNQFGAATINAVITNNPQLLVCAGSVNDVNVSLPAADILTDAKALLDTIIDGCSRLKKILFFETFPGHKNFTDVSNPTRSDWLAEYKNTIAALAGLNGYRNIVTYVSTYDAWGGDDYDDELTKGSSVTFPNPGTDYHPSSKGHLMMADIMFPYIISALSRIYDTVLSANTIYVGGDIQDTSADYPATITLNGHNCDLSGLTEDEYVTLKVKTGDPIPIAQGDNQTLKTSGGGRSIFGFGF